MRAGPYYVSPTSEDISSTSSSLRACHVDNTIEHLKLKLIRRWVRGQELCKKVEVGRKELDIIPSLAQTGSPVAGAYAAVRWRFSTGPYSFCVAAVSRTGFCSHILVCLAVFHCYNHTMARTFESF